MKPSGSSDSKPTVVLVVGTGRSGTSITAKILHERCGVSMGTRFRDSHFEDLDFKETDDLLFDGKITFAKWLNATEWRIKMLEAQRYAWGYKSPRSTILLGIYFALIRKPKIIHCARNIDAVVQSMMHEYGWKESDARSVASGRATILWNMLDRMLGTLEISFDDHLPENEIEEKLNNYLR